MLLAQADFDPWFVRLNLAEAVLWVAIGVGILLVRRSPRRVLLAVALVAFGISDVVETRTGAWYEPWWMLAWKTVCVVAIVGLCLVEFRKGK